MTDLERELRATLIAAGEQAPAVDDLAAQVSRPVRRRRYMLVAAVATVVAATGLGILASMNGLEQDGAASTPTPSIPSTGATLSLSAALIGTWRPVEIVGYSEKLPRLAADVSFAADGQWRGSDGCNGLGGTYKADDDGSFTAEADGATTMQWCSNVPNAGVIGGAGRFTIDDRTLVLYGADGHRLASYQRM